MPRANREAAAEFGEWFRAAMLSAGYSLDPGISGGRSKLSRAAGVPISMISRMSTGQAVPTVDMILHLAAVLNADAVKGIEAAGHHALAALLRQRSEFTEELNGILALVESADVTDRQRSRLRDSCYDRIFQCMKSLKAEIADVLTRPGSLP